MSTILVEARTLPDAWENAVLRCWNEGDQIATEYDKPSDPPSRDCTAVIVVQEPLAEPRLHKAIPGSWIDLEKYVQESVYGVHDHWIKPEEGKWSYTYHQRFRAYPYIDKDWSACTYDQIARVINQLVAVPHTRRAQAITWIPMEDQQDEHAPCVQRLWFRIMNGKLNMHLHIRSNDAYKAAFMNMWAMIKLQEYVAARVSEVAGYVVGVGEYKHIADSFHVYGSYFEQFNGFLSSVASRKWEDRTARSDDPLVVEMFEEARKELAAEVQVIK